MNVPRNADDLAEDFNAYVSPFFDGRRSVRVKFKGRYVENAQINERTNLDKAWYSQLLPVPICTISHG
jgi:hypothetical protein